LPAKKFGNDYWVDRGQNIWQKVTAPTTLGPLTGGGLSKNPASENVTPIFDNTAKDGKYYVGPVTEGIDTLYYGDPKTGGNGTVDSTASGIQGDDVKYTRDANGNMVEHNTHTPDVPPGYIGIRTAFDLDQVRKNMAGNYILMADIDLAGYTSATCTVLNGWVSLGYPIGVGNLDRPFTGIFDGNNYTISNIWAKHGISYAGLFSRIESNGIVKNLTISTDTKGINGAAFVGALAGVTRKGAVVDNVTVKGGTIISAGASGGAFIGGLIGYAYGGPADYITNCRVINSGIINLGNSATGSYSGGMFGAAAGNTRITNCYTTNVAVSGYSYVGGFIGSVYAGVEITDCKTNGMVDANGSYGGGFAGCIHGASKVETCIADVEVMVKGSYAGGFVGVLYENSVLNKAFAYGKVRAAYYAGGNVRQMVNSQLLNSFAYGDVTTTVGYISGGLVAESINSKILNCYSRGDVYAQVVAPGLGGLVGYFSGTATSSNTVQNSYSSGTVNGRDVLNPLYIGAFSGHSGVTFMGTNYYDYDKTKAYIQNAHGTIVAPAGQPSAFPVGKTTPQMMQKATFSGWDFNSTWKIDEGTSYPYFAWADALGLRH
jgi:hypothetical protein